MTRRLHLDLETYSACDLLVSGSDRYAEDPSTEILCGAYGWDSGEIRSWVPGDPIPDELLEADEVWAWNARFEQAILNAIWPGVVPIEKWRCTMTLALSYAFPGSLDLCAIALGVPGKDIVGRRSMLKLSKPRRPTKNDASLRWTKENAPADYPLLYEYNRVDVAVERRIHAMMPTHDLQPAEQKLYFIDMRANLLGLHCDLPTVRKIKGQIDRRGKELLGIAHELTGGLKMTQRAKLQDWLTENGEPLPDLKGITVENRLAEIRATHGTELTPAQQVLQIRSEVSQSSLAKYNVMLAAACRDNRIKGLVQFLGAARTGRWAGRLLQIQNFPKGILSDKAPWMIESDALLDADTLTLLYGDAFEIYASYLRSCMTATPGKVLVAADYSAIEARITAWLAGETWLVEFFASGGDPYCVQASDVFGFPVTKANDFERFVGKQLVLGCGFGMGVDKFMAHCAGLGVTIPPELAAAAIPAYRQRNKRIVALWYDMERALRRALRSPGAIQEHRGIRFKFDGRNWLQVRLLSGRLLSYYKPHVLDDRIRYMGVDQRTKDWGPQETWGGKIVENIVQATARDIMAHAILRIDAHHPEYTYLTSVHDEVIVECDPAHADAADAKRFARIVAELPAWAAGLPAKAEAWSGYRYRKAA